VVHRPQNAPSPMVSIALPVYNGAATVGQVVESVLEQTYSNLELVISDNASTDGTQEICRSFANQDRRVVYQRHASNIGLLNNFASAARKASGTYLRWIGDADSIEPHYVSRVLELFAAEQRFVLVTTQVVYTDDEGGATLCTDYAPGPLASQDPLERFREILRLLTSGYALVDPIYSMMRRELAVLPRRNMLREDETFAARLALAGRWGHVPLPVARRHRSEAPAAALVELLGVPRWHSRVMDLLQCRELFDWIERSALDPEQRRAARTEVLRMYARRKTATVRRGTAKLERMTGRPLSFSSSTSR
jgi:glycosyltransferase involved in cell wall biosynthesis